MSQRTFVDQMGRSISCSFPPKRIVSLVPSQTELLADLGMNDRVVGITRFCIRPELWPTTKTVIGGTKNFHFNTIDRLNPDVIIGNKEENYEEGISRLAKKYPVWMSDIVGVEEALSMIVSLGELVDRPRRARHLQDGILKAFATLKKQAGQSVLYLIWRNPWMASGAGTFVNSMLQIIGFRNAVENYARYPELSPEDIRSIHADYIFLSSEPFPFRQNHIEEVRRMSPGSEIFLVNGEYFTWYGSRMAKAPDYFNQLLSE